MSAYRQRLIGLDDRAGWTAALEGICHAFAHTWESCHAMHFTSGWPTFLYVAERDGSRVVCPIAERRWAAHADVATPYGFGGFVAQGEARDFLRTWRDFAERQGWVCAFIGLNPLFAPAACREQADYVEYNDVYVLDLRRDPAELHADLSENRRRQLRAAVAAEDWLIEDRGRLADFFLANATGFLAGKGAGAAYAFSRKTLEALLSLENVVLLGAGRGGRIQSVSVFAFTPHCAEYLFGISLPEGRGFSAALLWQGAMRLRALGSPLLNLGGGIRRGDGVAQFKERFGAGPMPLGSLRQVFRPDVYNALCKDAGADPQDRTGYFPAYRSAPTAAG